MLLIALIIGVLMQPQPLNLTVASFNVTIGSGTPMYGVLIHPNSSYVTYVNGPGLLYIIANSSVMVIIQGKEYNITNGSANLIIESGEERVAFINNRNYSVYLFYMYQHEAINGSYYVYDPVGIADYGIALYYGEPLLTYSYSTNEVIGVVQVRGLEAIDTVNACGVNVGDHYVDFQLNAIMETSEGYFLIQDVVVLNGSRALVIDNVWNVTTLNATLSGIYGSGSVHTFNGEPYYAYTEDIGELRQPFNLTLVMAVNGQRSTHVGFGYGVNGSIKWFDNVTIINAGEPRIIVNGLSYIRFAVPIDLELVLTGPVCGINALTKYANVTLRLLYRLNGSYYSPPYAWGIGTLTGETVSNATALPTGTTSVNVISSPYEYPGPLYYSVPVYINELNKTITLMVPKGYLINLTLGEPVIKGGLMIKPIGYIVNGTKTLMTDHVTLVINGPTELGIIYAYLVNVTFIGLMGNETPLTKWYQRGSVIRLSEPRYLGLLLFKGYVLSNGTLVTSNTINIVVNEPLVIKVLWGNALSIVEFVVMYVVLPLASLIVVLILALLSTSSLRNLSDQNFKG